MSDLTNSVKSSSLNAGQAHTAINAKITQTSLSQRQTN